MTPVMWRTQSGVQVSVYQWCCHLEAGYVAIVNAALDIEKSYKIL
jgi:hypothetical protein